MSRLTDVPFQCEHTLKHYAELIELGKKRGYEFTTFRDFDFLLEKKKIIVMRHDVDWRLDRALEIAKVEREHGIQSSFFIRLHAKEYNPFEFESYTILRQLQEWDFEIGLHFEVADVCNITGEEELQLFLREKHILEEIIDKDIVSATPHGGYSGLDYYGENYFFKRYNKATVGILNEPFEKRFWDDMKYLSDGYGFWREGCPCNYIGRVKRFQISTHPKWWYEKYYYIK